ncbi:504_t:CDS:2 [Diversispora eburnea]|uniref:504_t:CDS:1 n=1 Tax=Diversispora eburnea TaxID=1213867 RepID=A0A9N8UUW6_9GLOM|nr:504_t:CDS:2 [Diversispora eburnea]
MGRNNPTLETFKYYKKEKRISQRIPDDLIGKQQEFLSFILYRHIQYDYPLNLIGNMDETPLSFDIPSNMTVEETGASTVSICTTGHKKSNFTVVLSCMADGVVIRANREGYMNSDEMIWWIENVWNLPVVPGGLTSKLQPLDVCINKSFKNKYRECYNNWMAEEIKNLTPTGRIQCPAYNLVDEWVQTSWEKVDINLTQRNCVYVDEQNECENNENNEHNDERTERNDERGEYNDECDKQLSNGYSENAIIFDIGGVCVGSPSEGIAQYERKHNLSPNFINVSMYIREQLKTSEDYWIHLLKEASNETEPPKEVPDEIQKAYDILEQHNWTEVERISYEKTRMAILDDEDAIRTAVGEAVSDIAKKLLKEGVSHEIISKVTGLSTSRVGELNME